jgi:6-pyruvoyltetrahydropterin/6-carboxytetrahydropterin synthase
MTITCTRRVEFDAGHRVYGHESKCSHAHGHRYSVEITAEADLDSVGRVIDFSVLKVVIGGWIDANWDHGFICWDQDPIQNLIKQVPDTKGGPQKLFLLPYNPTAENMARYLLESVCPALLGPTGVRVTRIRLYETPNGYSDAET